MGRQAQSPRQQVEKPKFHPFAKAGMFLPGSWMTVEMLTAFLVPQKKLDYGWIPPLHPTSRG